MLTSTFEIKIIDLGYGLALEGRNKNGFMTTYVGTPMYLAPEIRAGVPYQGQDVDVFALGVTLLVSKLCDYPWSMPDIRRSVRYNQLVGERCINAPSFWEQY